jgi:hypothetical protein
MDMIIDLKSLQIHLLRSITLTIGKKSEADPEQLETDIVVIQVLEYAFVYLP